ncbi:hypothetical protein [Pedobacter miscanthi]|uniref:hypothetical protein n=1 Tax=Pedobacter miscanthi TaxID=2259170 RepID=UPI00292D5E9F|nr:hypothetical protein [Pedobacter miscanthi]
MEVNKIDIRVARKIDNYVIVINRGADDGIKSYMRFLVYDTGEEIFDPLSNDSLGNLEIAKGFFKVQHVQERITTLVSELRKPNNLLSAFSAFGDIDPKADLLLSVRVGDQVKIINEV